MKVLVIGGGGREHAICWKLAQDSQIRRLYCAPGNAGIAEVAECVDLPGSDFPRLAAFVREKEIDFTVVGPEQPLVAGIVDYFRAQKLPIFGPNAAAARMEGSKIFAKRLMAKYGIPTAHYEEFSGPAAALDYLRKLPEGPLVVKADGLAAGKGSVVCADRRAAAQAVDDLMNKRLYKGAGDRIIIEEFMRGEEVSLFVITDGKDYCCLSPAQDFKRALDGDQGKNTGGMGSYSPTPFLTPNQHRQALRKVVEPALAALQAEGIDYSGVLYCGLMLTGDGPKVVEFNCRFGDPETQVVLPLLQSDLLELLRAVASRTLGSHRLALAAKSAVCVVAASGGYPGDYRSGYPISGLAEAAQQSLIFHAGTRREEDQIVTAGGRVLAAAATAENLTMARERAYRVISKIRFQDMHFRRDIARRAVEFLEQHEHRR